MFVAGSTDAAHFDIKRQDQSGFLQIVRRPWATLTKLRIDLSLPANSIRRLPGPGPVGQYLSSGTKPILAYKLAYNFRPA